MQNLPRVVHAPLLVIKLPTLQELQPNRRSDAVRAHEQVVRTLFGRREGCGAGGKVGAEAAGVEVQLRKDEREGMSRIETSPPDASEVRQ